MDLLFAGLQMDEFLPKKFSGLGLNYNTMDDGGGSKYSSYKNYSSGGGDLSETEVTSSMLKGHDGMMAVLTTRYDQQLRLIVLPLNCKV